jgi:hypothetical protein
MNDENTGFAACSLYNAIKLHFTTDSYDYFKYNGKSNVTKDQFARRKDKFQFYKLAKKYSYDELVNFLVANFSVRNIKWAGDLLDTESDEIYRKWQKTKQSLTYTFEQDIMHLKDLVKDAPSELLKVNHGEYPKLLSEWLHGDIKLETICIMESLLKFNSMWSEKISENIIWPQKRNLIVKYTPFLKFDKDQCRNIMKEHLL